MEAPARGSAASTAVPGAEPAAVRRVRPGLRIPASVRTPAVGPSPGADVGNWPCGANRSAPARPGRSIRHPTDLTQKRHAAVGADRATRKTDLHNAARLGKRTNSGIQSAMSGVSLDISPSNLNYIEIRVLRLPRSCDIRVNLTMFAQADFGER